MSKNDFVHVAGTIAANEHHASGNHEAIRTYVSRSRQVQANRHRSIVVEGENCPITAKIAVVEVSLFQRHREKTENPSTKSYSVTGSPNHR